MVRRTCLGQMLLRGFLLGLGVACIALQSWGAIPLVINHQGIVKVDTVPFNGNGLFKFGLVDAAGNWLWTNDGSHLGQSAGAGNPTASVVVPVNNGIYHVGLGDVSLTNMVGIPSSVFDSPEVILRVVFNDGQNGEQVLAPDQPITSAAYAYHAAKADDAATVGGKTFSELGLVGEVRMWAGPMANVPSGWLPCDGRAVSRTTYAAIFAVLGTIYGTGDGSTTFNIPDFRDRSPVGARQDASGVPKTNVSGVLTQTGGESQHLLTGTEMPSHAHPERTYNYGGQLFSGTGMGGLSPTIETVMHASGPEQLMTFETGGGQSHNVLDPYFAITFIIKY